MLELRKLQITMTWYQVYMVAARGSDPQMNILHLTCTWLTATTSFSVWLQTYQVEVHEQLQSRSLQPGPPAGSEFPPSITDKSSPDFSGWAATSWNPGTSGTKNPEFRESFSSTIFQNLGIRTKNTNLYRTTFLNLSEWCSTLHK